MSEILIHSLKHTCKDAITILPILFLAYLIMEFMEQKTEAKTNQMIRKSGKMGPLYGALFGVLPQCGFSGAASSFYAGRVITVGTLIAVYLSTSDEMLPILISEKVPVVMIIKILALKALIGFIFGFLIDLAVRATRGRRKQAKVEEIDIHSLCEHDKCNCKENGIWLSALLHTLKIMIFIMAVSFVLNVVLKTVGNERLSGLIINKPIISELIAGLIGLIPNCAASVVITKLYVEGVLSFGAMMSGLLVGAGIGLLVLYRSNKNLKKNLAITGILYFCGVVSGIIIEILGLSV